MRTIPAAVDALLTSGNARSRARVSVKDSGGTYRDLSTYPTFNAIVGVNWGEEVDGTGLSADVTLRRDMEEISLAPLKKLSPLNRAWDPANGYAALLDVGRAVKIEAGVSADDEGSTPTWFSVFEGFIDEIDWAGETISLACRGAESQLQDAYLERERIYSFAQGVNATKGCFIFEPSRAYVLNDLVVPTQANLNGHFYKVTTAGTAAATEPTWPTGAGSTVTSGGAVFTEVGATSTSAGTAVETVLQQIINDAGVSLTLYTPVSPGWMIKWYLQERTSAWEALKKLVDQIGWDLRFRYDDGTSAWRLTLVQPDRATTTSLRTFNANQVRDVKVCKVARDGIRNVVRVLYSDSTALDAAGAPTRKSVEVTDAASLAAYGRRWMEVAESSSSNIDSSTEATTMANAILADLATPVVEIEPVLFSLFLFVQLHDLYTFGAGPHTSDPQKLAVIGYRHEMNESGESSTSFRLRGKPASGQDRWLGTQSADTHLSVFGNADGVSLAVADVVGGTRLKVSETLGKRAKVAGYEFHVSTVNGFTPDSSTLKARGLSREAVITDLPPGVTHYAKIIPYGFNDDLIVKGGPSAQTSFAPGYLQGRHVYPYLDFRAYPLNGNFESPGTLGIIPDVWSVDTGTWGTDLTTQNANLNEGSIALELKATAVATAIRSGWVPVNQGLDYILEWWWADLTGGTAANGHHIAANVVWYDSAQTVISGSTDTVNVATTTPGFRRFYVTAPATAAWCRVVIAKDAFTDMHVAIDSVRVLGGFDPWKAIGAVGQPAFGTNWQNIGGAYQSAGYRIDTNGRVYLRGTVKRTAGAVTTIFTLPAGYRPSNGMIWAVPGDNAFARIDVDSGGNVILQAGTAAAFLALDGISFDTR